MNQRRLSPMPVQPSRHQIKQGIGSVDGPIASLQSTQLGFQTLFPKNRPQVSLQPLSWGPDPMKLS